MFSEKVQGLEVEGKRPPMSVMLATRALISGYSLSRSAMFVSAPVATRCIVRPDVACSSDIAFHMAITYRPLAARKISTILEAAKGKIDGFFGQLPHKCHQNRVASVGIDFLSSAPRSPRCASCTQMSRATLISPSTWPVPADHSRSHKCALQNPCIHTCSKIARAALISPST